MGPTALRAEDFFALKIRRLRPGANPRTWVPKTSTLRLDHRSRYPYGKFPCISSDLPRKLPHIAFIALAVHTVPGSSYSADSVFWLLQRLAILQLRSVWRWHIGDIAPCPWVPSTRRERLGQRRSGIGVSECTAVSTSNISRVRLPKQH